MSGLYNVLFEQNAEADKLLAALGLAREDFTRFRDAFVAEGEIAVYTRLGGPNREAYADTIKRLQAHPLHLRDRDDGFDETYATFYFKVPANERGLLVQDIGKWDPDARWKDGLARLEKGDESDPLVKRGVELGRRMFGEMAKVQPGQVSVFHVGTNKK